MSAAPVDASDEGDVTGAAVAAVVAAGVVEANVAGTVPPADEPVVDGEVTGPPGIGHEASADPPSAVSIPQIVTGSVTPVPGLPGLPIGRLVEPVPVHVPSAVPFRAPVTAHTVTGAFTGADPVALVATCVGSHEFEAVPSTATTRLQALTGNTPSTGALWLTLSLGRSFTSVAEPSGMQLAVAVPSTSATAPQAVTGAKTSAACPDCDAVSVSWGQFVVLSPSISTMTLQTVTGTYASTAPC
jgi:hypothetical protein